MLIKPSAVITSHQKDNKFSFGGQRVAGKNEGQEFIKNEIEAIRMNDLDSLLSFSSPTSPPEFPPRDSGGELSTIKNNVGSGQQNS